MFNIKYSWIIPWYYLNKVQKQSSKPNPMTFHWTDWFIGILTMAYLLLYTLYIAGEYFIPQSYHQPGSTDHCSLGLGILLYQCIIYKAIFFSWEKTSTMKRSIHILQKLTAKAPPKRNSHPSNPPFFEWQKLLVALQGISSSSMRKCHVFTSNHVHLIAPPPNIQSHMSHEKNPYYFPLNPGWFIGILNGLL